LMLFRTDAAHIDLAGVDACRHIEAQPPGGLPYLDGGEDSAFGIALVGLGRAEDRQRPIAEKAVNAPLILNQDIHHGFEEAIDEIGSVFRMEMPGRLYGIAHIGKEDGDDAVFALRRGEELLAEGIGKALLKGGELLLQ